MSLIHIFCVVMLRGFRQKIIAKQIVKLHCPPPRLLSLNGQLNLNYFKFPLKWIDGGEGGIETLAEISPNGHNYQIGQLHV